MIIALLPLSHFVLGLLCYAGQRTARWLTAIGWAIGAALSIALIIEVRDGSAVSVVLGGWPADLGIVLSFDIVAATFAPLALLLELAVILYVRKEEHHPVFYALLQFLFGAVFALLLAQDLFNEYVILELSTLVSFLLVGYERRPIQIWTSLKYMILASIGMSLFLIGVAIVYRHTGTLNLRLIADILTSQHDVEWLPLASTLLVAGVAVKAGVFVFSQWLPSAHSVAPPAVSALLSGLVIKMGIVVVYRLSQALPLATTLQVLGSATALLGVLYAAYAVNLKRMLAFSTLSQIGYLVLGLAVGTPVALAGTLDYAIAHGLLKGLLFLAAGEAAIIAGSDRFADLIAQRQSLPFATVIALLVGTLGIVGLPPLAGFGAKAVLLDADPNLFVVVVFALTSVGTAFAFAKLLPLFRFARTPRSRSKHTAAYAVLALPVLLFMPWTQLCYPCLHLGGHVRPLLVLESAAAIVVGVLLHHRLRTWRPGLPKAIFFLEEATVGLILGLLIIYGLLRL